MTLSKETEVIFDWRRGVECHSANPPLYDSPAFHQTSPGGDVKYNYTRSSNPNHELLEEELAQLEQGKFALAFASSVAAISAVLLTFKSGNHVILSDDVYGGTFRLTEQILNRFNIESTTIDTIKLGQIKGAIQSNTKLIYTEAPSNPCFKVTDIKAVSEIARKHEPLIAVNNTFMAPLGQLPLLLSTDIVIHSATKFLSRHSNLVAGAIITNNETISDALYLIQNGTGNMLSARGSRAFTKHLKAFPIRFKQSVENTRKIVSFLTKQDEISEVYYPGLATAHLEQAKNDGVIIGFRLADESKARQSVDALTLPLISASLGDIETTLSHPATMFHAALPEEVGQERGITFGLFRLGVGLEGPGELIADIRYALKEAFNESIPHTTER